MVSEIRGSHSGEDVGLLVVASCGLVGRYQCFLSLDDGYSMFLQNDLPTNPQNTTTKKTKTD
jgi:hypothetical protein